jgi:hypothetical protein
MENEKRLESRYDAKDYYHAEIRLVGVPVYEVKLKNLSKSGACFLVKEDSSLLNYMRVGESLKVKYFLEDRSESNAIHTAEIRHVTPITDGRFNGHCCTGLSILD